MQVIFDKNLAESLKDRHTILELDTVMQEGLEEPITLFAVVDIGLEDIYQLPNLKELHAQMIFHYKSGEWHLIPHAIEPLMGKWRGELDSFYNEVLDFSEKCAMLNKTWDGVRHTKAP